MRSTFSCVGLFSLSMLATATALAARAPPPPANMGSSRVIVGSANAKHFKAQADGEFYLQAATFKTANGAKKYQHQLSNRIQYPITVQPRGIYHVVLVGPVHTAAEVRELGNAMSGSSFVKNQTARPVSTSHEKMAPMHVNASAMDKNAALMPKGVANHFELIGALGVAAVTVGNSELGISSSETDRLVQTNGNNWNYFTGQLGVGYVHYFRDIPLYPERVEWFTAMEPQVNAYYIGANSIAGDVWRFDSPNFNQLTYSMPFNSTRLMFDSSLTIATLKHLSLYAIGGIGNAWNKLGYSDADKGTTPCVDQRLQLNSITDSSFVWEAGAGLQYAFSDRIGLSLEYLYTDLGSMKLSNQGSAGSITTPLIVPGSFHLNSQAALLGLHIAL